jgi:hypothetical protein
MLAEASVDAFQQSIVRLVQVRFPVVNSIEIDRDLCSDPTPAVLNAA